MEQSHNGAWEKIRQIADVAQCYREIQDRYPVNAHCGKTNCTVPIPHTHKTVEVPPGCADLDQLPGDRVPYPCPDPGQEPLDEEGERIKQGLERMISNSAEMHPCEADYVNHPPHYKSGGMEAIDVIEAFARTNYHRGNALKYLLRAGRKGDTVEDLRKAIWYIEREIGAAA